MNKRKIKSRFKEGELKSIFIEKSKSIFGNKFSYDNLVYKDTDSYATITCDIHGDISVIPKVHLKSPYGCQQCVINAKSLQSRITMDSFLSRAIAMHGDLYDYSDVILTTTKNKVLVHCKKGHSFFIEVTNHLQGNGCRQCYLNSTRPDSWGWSKTKWVALQKGRLAKLYIYKVKFNEIEFIKIGITYVSGSYRVKTILKALGEGSYMQELKTIESLDALMIHNMETCSKNSLKKFRYNFGFEFPGHTECYQPTPEVLSYINNL